MEEAGSFDEDVLLVDCSTGEDLLLLEVDAVDVLFATKALGWPDDSV